MNAHIKNIILMCICLSGCSSTNPTVSASNVDNYWFYISGVLPPNTTPFIVGQYTSSDCTNKKLEFIGGFGSGKSMMVEKNQHQSYSPEIKIDPVTRTYSTKLPKNGGSSCNWALGNVTIGLKVATLLDENNKPATIRLNVKSYGSSQFSIEKAKADKRKIVKGKLTVDTVYYTSTEFLFNSKKKVKIIDNIHYGFKYALINDSVDTYVEFSPKLDLDYVVKFYEKINPNTNKPTFSRVYPNGVVDNDKDAVNVRPYKFYEKESK